MTTAILVRVCDHTLYLDGRAMKVVVDLGMNKGEFANWVVNNTDARCVGVEPVPALYRTLPQGDRIEAEQAAVGAKPGKQNVFDAAGDLRVACVCRTDARWGSS